MKDEYIIINRTTLEKRIEELEKIDNKEIWEHMEFDTLKHVLSQSTPLIPEIEKAFNESRRQNSWAGGNLYGDGYDEEEDLTDFKYKTSQDYISNLKLGI